MTGKATRRWTSGDSKHFSSRDGGVYGDDSTNIYFPKGSGENERLWSFSMVYLPHITLAFSYETLIAFTHSNEWVIRENHWGRNTGQHMEYLIQSRRDHDARLPGADFYAALARTMEHPEVLLDIAARQAMESMRDL